jgi:hypothetical protein
MINFQCQNMFDKNWLIIQIPFPHAFGFFDQSNKPFQPQINPKRTGSFHCTSIKIKNCTNGKNNFWV